MILTRRCSQKWLNFEKIRETRAESAPSSLRELDRDFSLPRRSPKFWTKEDDSDDAPIRAIFPLLSFESLFLTNDETEESFGLCIVASERRRRSGWERGKTKTKRKSRKLSA